MNKHFETAVIGGGVVGAAIGYGLAKLGRSAAIFDGDDLALRASRTNFGLVWVQGKGDGFTPYQHLTRKSSDLWPAFAAELQKLTGIDLEYRRTGGLVFCLSDDEIEEERRLSQRMVGQSSEYSFEICERSRLEKMLPKIKLGSDVVGACFSELDGHVNPLLLLRALLKAFVLSNGTLMTNRVVNRITPFANGFRILSQEGEYIAQRVIIAAGIQTMSFKERLDLPVHLAPQRGQLLITERVEPVLPYAAIGIRQTASGSFQLGGTYEDVGPSTEVTSSAARSISARAIKVIPALASLRVIRQWAGLRVLSPDGYPIYDQSQLYPGIHVATCHSGVTLAAYHAGPFAQWLSLGSDAGRYAAFSGSRFSTKGVAV